jgi:EmrB/QacA subfamily drug resistance transporter
VNSLHASKRDPGGEQPDEIAFSPRRWMALAVLIAAGFMDLLDTTIVNVAIPSIRNSLQASYAEIQWIVAGYLLALAVGLITGGRLGDIAGRKRVFIVGVVAFGLTSLASGLAPTGGVLVVTRVLQGLSAAIMIPQILSVVQVSFPRREQTRALALYSSVAGIAVMSGPLLAGVLLDVFHWSWRSIFLINVPVTVVVALAAAAVLPESKAPRARRMDPGGVALVSAGLFALVFGIIEGRQFGWPAWTLLLMIASVPLFILFARYERRYERRGHSPIVSPELFGQRAFSSGIIVVVVFFTGVVGFFLAFTVFLQLGLGFTPLESALTTFPSSVGLAVASLVSAKLVPRFGSRVLAVGALVMATAMAGLVATIHAHGAALTAWEVRPVILVFGLGMGLIIPPLAEVVLAGVDERHAGAASGVINTGMQVGNAVGVAIVGVILFSAIAAQAPKSVAKVQPELSRQLTAAGVPAPVRDAATAQFATCFVDQSRQEDPAALPASCRRDAASSLPSPIREKLFAALDAAGERGRADDFVASIQRALLYEVGVFVVTVVLLLLLPFGARRAGRRRGELVH